MKYIYERDIFNATIEKVSRDISCAVTRIISPRMYVTATVADTRVRDDWNFALVIWKKYIFATNVHIEKINKTQKFYTVKSLKM